MKKIGRLFFKILCVIGIFFLTAEVGLRLAGSYRSIYLVEMWRYGNNHKESVSDRRRHRHRPGTKSEVMGHPVSINAIGLRAPEFTFAPAKKRMLVVGDSITFGFGVAENEAYPKLLEAALPGWEVWNAGVGNYNTEQELEQFLQLAPVIKPHALLMGFFINDLEPPQHQQGWGLGRYSLVVSLPNQIYWVWNTPHANDYAEYHRQLFWQEFPRWKNVVLELKGAAGRERIPLTVLLIPELRGLRSEAFKAEYEAVEKFLRENGIAPCRGDRYFPRDGDSLGREYWAARDDSHPNAAGHDLLARAAIDCIRDLP